MPETTQPAAAGQTTPCPFSSERELDYFDLVSEATIINQDQGNANVLLGDVLAPDAEGYDFSERRVVSDALASGIGHDIWADEAQIYQVNAVRMSFGARLVGVLLIGRAIDDDAAATVYRQTGTGVAVLLDGKVIAASELESGPVAPTDLARGLSGGLGERWQRRLRHRPRPPRGGAGPGALHDLPRRPDIDGRRGLQQHGGERDLLGDARRPVGHPRGCAVGRGPLRPRYLGAGARPERRR